jgi:hypothetical protein
MRHLKVKCKTDGQLSIYYVYALKFERQSMSCEINYVFE